MATAATVAAATTTHYNIIHYLSGARHSTYAAADKIEQNNMLSSHVKRSPLLWLHNKSRRCSTLGLQRILK